MKIWFFLQIPRSLFLYLFVQYRVTQITRMLHIINLIFCQAQWSRRLFWIWDRFTSFRRLHTKTLKRTRMLDSIHSGSRLLFTFTSPFPLFLYLVKQNKSVVKLGGLCDCIFYCLCFTNCHSSMGRLFLHDVTTRGQHLQPIINTKTFIQSWEKLIH